MKMLPHDAQLSVEQHYSRRLIDGYLAKAIRENPQTEAKVHKGVSLLEDWIAEDYYDSKTNRLEQLKRHDLEQLVRDVFIGVCYCQKPELFVSVTSQLASKLHFDDKSEAITTIAEVTSVLCHTDAYDIIKVSREASLMIQSQIPLPRELIESVARSEYLPPLVMEPLEVENNYQSPYLTLNDSVVLGRHNGHDGELCLDVINGQNRVPMALDIDFLNTLPEIPTHALDTAEKLQLWTDFRNTSTELYQLMVSHGNRFWFHHKVDKRGRLYAQGYHITPQGTPFKKAMLEFADPEVVEGVPYEHQI